MAIIKKEEFKSIYENISLIDLNLKQFNDLLGKILNNKEMENVNFLKKQRFVLLEYIHEL